MTAEKERARGSSDGMTGERVKVWTHLGTCLLTGAALSLASSDASAQILKSGSALDSHGSAIVAIAPGGEGGEGGEGAKAVEVAKVAKAAKVVKRAAPLRWPRMTWPI